MWYCEQKLCIWIKNLLVIPGVSLKPDTIPACRPTSWIKCSCVFIYGIIPSWVILNNSNDKIGIKKPRIQIKSCRIFICFSIKHLLNNTNNNDGSAISITVFVRKAKP